MSIDIDEKNLKHGVLGLVMALVEIIQDALRLQALRRVEGGGLSPEEEARLGEALLDLEEAIAQIKVEQGISEAVKNVRDGIDELVDDVLEQILHPETWSKETKS